MSSWNFQVVWRRYIATASMVALAATADAQYRHSTGAGFDERSLATQVALDRAGFSPGELDGRAGAKTRQALLAYRELSKETLDEPSDPLTTYTITEQDASGPFIDELPSDLMAQSRLQALDYTSILEALSEKFHSSPGLLSQLNPGASWKPGESIRVPAVETFELPAAASRGGRAGARSGNQGATPAGSLEVILTGATKSLVVRDASGRTLMYAPVTTGSEHDPLPIGEWNVVRVSWSPVFNYNPDLFWDADPSHSKAKIAAGPNNPVGVVWIDINKEHFGLHGTPEPANIGRSESHGCIRLTNWDATRLGHLVRPGTRVILR
jgi:lipoprotein-anchoring transpeptidase ErfK/SrfK